MALINGCTEKILAVVPCQVYNNPSYIAGDPIQKVWQMD